MIKLSVNVNKIATLRNARGGNIPDLIKTALDIESYGAHGITVHPRPDERHIRYNDVHMLSKSLSTEFNIEGYPSPAFIDLVLSVKPHQVTLVPDRPDALTSNAGWDTIKNKTFLTEVVKRFNDNGIRTSVFVDANPVMAEHAAYTGTKRVELYTESYARFYPENREKAIAPFIKTAEAAIKNGLEINAGHDLNLQNLKYFAENIPSLMEVSIGHALICDAIYYGLENVVHMYLHCIDVKNKHNIISA